MIGQDNGSIPVFRTTVYGTPINDQPNWWWLLLVVGLVIVATGR